MNRNAIILLILGLLGAAAFFLLYRAPEREVPDVVVPTMKAPPEQQPPATPTPLPPRPTPRPAPAADVVESPSGLEAAGAPEALTGPFEVELGTHTITLRERDAVLHVSPTLTTPSFETRSELYRRRRDLVRMLFFLVSHRTRQGLDTPEGKASLHDDLLARFRNVVRSGRLEKLEFTSFMVEDLAPDD